MSAPVPLTLPVIEHLPNLVAVGMPPSRDYAVPTDVVVSAWAAREIDRLLPGERLYIIDHLSERSGSSW